MSLDTILTNLETAFDGMTGLTGGCTQQPPVIVDKGDFPFAIVYVRGGNLTAVDASYDKNLHTIVFQIHQSQMVVPQAFTAVKVWPERFMSIVKPLTNVDLVYPAIYTAGPVVWNEEFTHYAVTFSFSVKDNVPT